MPQEDKYTQDIHFDADDGLGPEEGFGPGAALASFPASVQRTFDQAASRLRDGDAWEGLSLMHQAGIELSRADPLAFAGLVAAQMGLTGVSVTRAARTVRTVRTERRVLGVRYGEDSQTTTDESFEERAIRFLGGGR